MNALTSRYQYTVPANLNLPPVRYQTPERQGGFGTKTVCNVIRKYKIQVLSYMLCSAGLLWQLSSLSEGYFKYQMISKVFYLKNDTVVPPAMSICMPFVELINLEQIGFQDLNITSEFDREEILRKVTVKQVFEATPDFKDLIAEVWIRKRNSYGLESSLQSFQVNKFVKNDDVCYRIQNRYSDEPGFAYKSHQITFGLRPGIIFYFGLNKTMVLKLTEADIYLHQTDMYPRGDRDFPIYFGGTDKFVSAEAQSLYGISQVKETFHLLPAPFETNCKNYKAIEYETEYHCIYSCMSGRFLEKYNRTIFTTVFTEPADNLTIVRAEVMKNQTLQGDIDNFLNECKESCPGSSCEKIYFLPLIIDTRDSADQLVFQLFDMNGLEMTADFNSKTPLAEFTVQALSVSGVWLGLSCSDILINFLCWIILKRWKKSEVNHRYWERKRQNSNTFTLKKFSRYFLNK